MKGLFIPEITAQMFRSGCLESIETLMAEGEIYDIEYSPWIPVSERLPNHDEYVKNNGLFNVSDGNRSYSLWFDIYGKQRFGEPTMYGFRIDRAVTAWMPLPKPYEPQGSEG